MHKSGEGESIFKIEEGRRRASVIGNSEILDDIESLYSELRLALIGKK